MDHTDESAMPLATALACATLTTCQDYAGADNDGKRAAITLGALDGPRCGIDVPPSCASPVATADSNELPIDLATWYLVLASLSGQ